MKIHKNNETLVVNINNRLRIYNDGSVYIEDKEGWDNCVDSPAYEWGDGSEGWCFEGKLHRKYGPARNWRNGDSWYFEGDMYPQEEFMEKFL